MDDLYVHDVAAWAERQAELLRRLARGEQINDQPDWPNIAEEIEDVAASQRREIRNRLAVLCEYLLKWAYQSDRRSGSWRGSIVEARERIADVIEESPLSRHLSGRAAAAFVLGWIGQGSRGNGLG
jgi:hypothetical protein